MHKQTIYHKAYISFRHIQVNDVHAYFSPYVYSVNSYVNIVSNDFCLSEQSSTRVMYCPICN